MSAMRRVLGLLLLAILLPACGGGGGGGGGGGAPPTPFTVVQRVPGSLATGVVRTATLYVRLNRAANAATVNATNVNLELNGTIAVPRSVTFDAQNLLVVIDPTNPLDASSTYRVTLGTGVQDTGGVALTADTFTFSTSANADTTLPAFGGAAFALDSATTTQLVLDWNAATDASAPISYELFLLPSGGVFDPTSTPNETTTNLTDTLTGLLSNTRHNLRLRARDAAGNLSAELHVLNGAKTLTSFAQDVYAGIINNPGFVSRCTRCHVPGGLEIVPFTMETSAIAYGNLVDVNADCTLGPGVLPPGTKRVLSGGGTGNRDASFLYQKITAPDCGVRMPRDGFEPGQRYLNGTEIQTIGDWIVEGALDN